MAAIEEMPLMTHEDDPRVRAAFAIEAQVRAIEKFLRHAEEVQALVDDVRPSTAASMDRTLVAWRMESIHRLEEARRLRRLAGGGDREGA